MQVGEQELRMQLCAMQDEEGTATDAATRADMPGPGPTSPAQLTTRYRQRKAAVYFGYAILLTVLSVYNAFATGSFSWSSTSVLRQNAVFGMSAVLEASGLAYGVGMSIRLYFKANERITWSDVLSEPYTIALEGVWRGGQRGRTIFCVGQMGTLCQCIIGYATFLGVPIRREGREVESGVAVAVFFGVLLVVWSHSCCKLQYAHTTDFVNTVALIFVFPLMIQMLEVYHLILLGASFINCTLIVLDALSILPLAIASLGIFVAGPLLWLCRCIYKVVRNCCPSSSIVEVLDPERGVSFIVGHFARSNVLESQGNGQQRVPLYANASAAPAI